MLRHGGFFFGKLEDSSFVLATQLKELVEKVEFIVFFVRLRLMLLLQCFGSTAIFRPVPRRHQIELVDGPDFLLIFLSMPFGDLRKVRNWPLLMLITIVIKFEDDGVGRSLLCSKYS